MGKEDEIRLIAYHIWEEEGCQDGYDCEHWFRAEALWEKKDNALAVPIGSVSEFFARPVVAGINLTGSIKIGDVIKIKGHTTDLEFTIHSMQINNTSVQEAKAGTKVGIKVPDRVRIGDNVYKKSE
jgi:translation elongation factor EF-Tu-like GTPase